MQNQKRSLKPMLFLVKRQLPYYAVALCSALASVLLGFVTPALLAELFDHHISGLPSRLPVFIQNILNTMITAFRSPIAYLYVFGALVLLVNIIKGAFAYFKGVCCAKASENNAKYLRDRLYAQIQYFDYQTHVQSSTGDLVQRCTSDVDTVRRFLNVQLLSIANSVMLVGIAILLMFPISTKITLMGIVPLPFLLLYSWKFFGILLRAYERSENAEGHMSAVLQESLTGIRVVRAFGRQQTEVDKFNRANDAHYTERKKIVPLDALYWTSGDLFSATQSLIIMATCIFENYHGRISLGDMVILITYSAMLMGPTRQLGRILSDAGRSIVALDRIMDVLRTPKETMEQGLQTPRLNQDITFQNVSFSYPDGKLVLKDISMVIPHGQTTAILGATGSGKSTLVQLLQRLYEPTSGQILLGDTPFSSLDKQHIRRRLGLILQETFLFSRTIKENVMIANPHADEASVHRACEDARALDFINEHEQGFNTLIGERGITLSGGQKQRVAIARMLLKENDIIIFDDSLSAVDTKTDAAIRSALQNRRDGLTTIIISHRMSTLRQADYIYVLDQGRIAEQGTHQALISTPGIYQRIYRIQNSVADNA